MAEQTKDAKLVRINDQVVVPVDLGKDSKKKFKGSKLFDEQFPNVFLVAKKKAARLT